MSDPRTFDLKQLGLIADVLDGVAEAHEVASLEHLMLADAKLRRLYMTYAEIHARLTLSANRQAAPFATTDHSLGRIGVARWAVVAAAVIVVGLLVVFFIPGGATQNESPKPIVAQLDAEPTAVVVNSSGVQWLGDPLAAGQQLAGQRVMIGGGMMEMAFLDGATVRISGPTDMQITGPSETRLHAGRLWARLTTPGSHFKVEGSNFTVVDVGTEFGVNVTHGRDGQVHVFDGTVLVTVPGKPAERLTAGQSIHIDASGNLRAVTQTADTRAVYMGIPAGLVDWGTFNDGTCRDLIGHADGQLHGSARIESGRLVLDGIDGYLITPMLDHDLSTRTLIVWVRPQNIEQRGAGVIAIESPQEEPDVFDGLTLGEYHAGAWENSSNYSHRSDQASPLGPILTQVPTKSTMIALTYEVDGRITMYLDGVQQGQVRLGDTIHYRSGTSRIIMGKRHSEAGSDGPATVTGVDPFFAGEIDSVMVFNRVLDASQIARIGGLINETTSTP